MRGPSLVIGVWRHPYWNKERWDFERTLYKCRLGRPYEGCRLVEGRDTNLEATDFPVSEGLI